MNKKKSVLCIELLRTFSSDELEGLEKVLSCEYFNTDVWVKKLLKTLEKYTLKSNIFDDDIQGIIYQEVFEHLPAPEGALKKNERDWLNKKLNKLMSLAELFLSIQQVKKNDEHKCDLLYPELLARKQYQSFNRHIKKDKVALDKRDNKGAEYYAQKYKIEKTVRNYLHQNGRFFTKESNLSDLIRNLDMYYALDKLDVHIAALSMRHVPDAGEYDLSSMDATAPLLNLPQYIDNPLIMLYQANLILMKTESEVAYSDLLSHLNQYESSVPTNVLKGFYTSAINHCVGQIKRGQLEYKRKMFDLYKIMDEKQLLINGGIIPVVKLKNAVTVGCRVEEYAWAINTIEYYRPYIREEIRDSVYHFNLGTVAFYQKDYATAHSKFIQVNRINKTYDVNVRILIIKCLYEDKADYDYMMQSFRTTKKFFKENTSLPPKDKRGYTNFIKILVRLYRVSHNVNATKIDIEKVEKELNAQKVNSDKRWLLEKIEESKQKLA